MKILVSTLMLFISVTSFAQEKSHYKTTYERSSNYAGAPWADGTWSETVENVVGPCKDYGREDNELNCYNRVKSDGFEFYQMTSHNHFHGYNGSLWDTTSYDFKKCFACASSIPKLSETLQAIQNRKAQAQQAQYQVEQANAVNLQKKETINQQEKVKSAQKWIDYAAGPSGGPSAICEYVAAENSGFSSQCQEAIKKIKLSRSAIATCMATAVSNVGFAAQAIEAAGENVYSKKIENVLIQISYQNAGFAVGALKAAAGKSYSDSEVKQCAAVAKANVAFGVDCLEENGTKSTN